MKKSKVIFTILIVFLFLTTVKAYERYKIGDKVNYNGIDYYVIKNSGKDTPYITLLKEHPLNTSEISDYNNSNYETIGLKSFSSNPNLCTSVDNQNGCTNNYSDTKIKAVVDNWAKNEIGNENLAEVNGYKSRLINEQDLSNLGYGIYDNCDKYSYALSCNYNEKNNNNMFSMNYECTNGKCYYLYDVSISNNGFNGLLRSCTTVSENGNSTSAKSTIDGIILRNGCNISLCGGNNFETQVGMLSDYFNVDSSQSSKTCIQQGTDFSTLTSDLNYEWLNYNNIPYWTMVNEQFYEYIYAYYPSDNTFVTHSHRDYAQPYENYAVRPVLNFKKSVLGSKNSYEIGDKISFNNEEYYVLENSDLSKDYVTVLKNKPLTNRQIDIYENNSNYGLVEYYSSESCGVSNDSGCTNDYNQSYVKKIIDTWAMANTNADDLVTKKGYSARLITVDELLNNLGYYNDPKSDMLISKTEDTPEWVYNTSGYYWTMPYEILDNKKVMTTKVLDNIISSEIYSTGLIRPVINLKKCALNDPQCLYCPNGKATFEVKLKYNKFNLGDKVTYNDEDYYVLNDVENNDKHYVTIIKKNNLTKEDLEKYGKDSNNEYFINKYTNNGSSIWASNNISFYTSESCKTSNGRVIKENGCSNAYETSDVKKVLDNWANDKFDLNDLVNVDGYKYRLLNDSDLTNTLGISKEENTDNCFFGESCYLINSSLPFFYNLYGDYWTMVSSENSKTRYVGYFNYHEISETKVYQHYGVRPVLNVNKCAIDDGCSEQQELVTCEEFEDDPEDDPIINPIIEPKNPDDDGTNSSVPTIDVDNTLSIISKISIIIGSILILAGVSVICYFRYDLKKNKNSLNKKK